MNMLSTNTQQSMTSLEIAELVNSRHDNVKRTIETLVKQAVITSPQIEEKPTAGRPSTFYIFTGEQGKRDSIIVVAQLSPEFTARLVDRWAELENQQPKPQELSRMDILQIAMEAEKENIELKETIQLQAPKVEFYDKIVDCTGLSSATQVALKHNLTARELNTMLYDLEVYSLNMDPKKGKVFRKWFIDQGYGKMKHHVGSNTQPMFTTKGEQWIFDNI